MPFRPFTSFVALLQMHSRTFMAFSNSGSWNCTQHSRWGHTTTEHSRITTALVRLVTLFDAPQVGVCLPGWQSTADILSLLSTRHQNAFFQTFSHCFWSSLLLLTLLFHKWSILVCLNIGLHLCYFLQKRQVPCCVVLAPCGNRPLCSSALLNVLTSSSLLVLLFQSEVTVPWWITLDNKDVTKVHGKLKELFGINMSHTNYLKFV